MLPSEFHSQKSNKGLGGGGSLMLDGRYSEKRSNKSFCFNKFFQEKSNKSRDLLGIESAAEVTEMKEFNRLGFSEINKTQGTSDGKGRATPSAKGRGKEKIIRKNIESNNTGKRNNTQIIKKTSQIINPSSLSQQNKHNNLLNHITTF